MNIFFKQLEYKISNIVYERTKNKINQGQQLPLK